MADIILVRALTTSDLGLFAAHRASASSKQRAININAKAAAQLLNPIIYENGGTLLDCIVTFGDLQERSPRTLSKVHKNWRLGGNKIEGLAFAQLDSRDFMLLRSPLHNDGKSPISITFVSRTTDRERHARIAGYVAYRLKGSMTVYAETDAEYSILAEASQAPPRPATPASPRKSMQQPVTPRPAIAPMPATTAPTPRARTIKDKLRSPNIIEQMLKVAGDLSAPAQLAFMETVEQLASQLRTILIQQDRIIRIEKNHTALWNSVAGQPVGFVHGGMANLAMIGAAPVAVRVGGYIVTPGDRTPERETFVVLKKLISEIYAGADGGVYYGSFPDYGALRDAARISIEAAGGVHVLLEHTVQWLFLHGALVNPVSRYTDVMRDGRPVHRFPNFSADALRELLPANEPYRTGLDANFVSVYLRQLQLLQTSNAVVCGVVERESHTTSVIQTIVASLNDHEIQSLLPRPAAQWKAWFLASIDPRDDEQAEGPRITDSLLFRCILEPGEALRPVPINRNDMRRAPQAWASTISQYPQPLVSYLQPTEWNAPIRIELFTKDVSRFRETATLVMHCALLLPRYAFPVGLDIVDKFARIPNWMSRPVNTHTAVQALRGALDRGDTRLFDALRRMLCGSEREWLLRPRAL